MPIDIYDEICLQKFKNELITRRTVFKGEHWPRQQKNMTHLVKKLSSYMCIDIPGPVERRNRRINRNFGISVGIFHALVLENLAAR